MTSVAQLINTFIPTHYDLSLSLDREAHSFGGVVTINGTTTTDATDIRVHAKDLTINSVVIDGKQATFSHEPFDELHISHPDITGGTAHVVVIDFNGTITDTMNGIYPSRFEVDGVKKELLTTQFESHYARQAFPCVDEPAAKATFDVTLTTETGITVLGNMPIARQNEEDGKLVTSFETTPRMSTYLVAWVAGELQRKTTTTKDGVEVNVWATPAQSPESLDFALSFAARTIEFFDEYFGVPYPLPKSDHVAIPDFSAGAMENWGLITYREIALLADPSETSIATKQYVATVIAHELSHQWFGNLVTMKWWNDLWLNESFANMMEYIAVDALEPSWNVWLDHASNEVISALRRDSLDGVQAIQTDVTHPDEISTIFDPSIVYAKGGRLLRMLQAFIGTEALREGLKQYFIRHKYENTEADDLWVCLSEASGKNVGDFMNSWIKQPGYPVITATQSNGIISLNAAQFFIGEHGDHKRQWPVPLHGSSDEVPEILTDTSASFTYSSEEPFRLNASGTAHFITHYDKPLLADLIASLDKLPVIDRLQLLHEQTLLAEAGVISFAELIPLLDAYKNEREESVWGIMSLAINSLKRFVETDLASEEKLRALVKKISEAEYTRLGWTAQAGEPENDTKLRSIIISLALYGENDDAIKTATSLYLDRKTTPLDPELRTAIMANAVRQEITPSVIDELIQEHRTTQLSELQDDIASALTSAKNTETIQRLIDLLKDTTFIRPQDFTHWYVWLIRNRYGRTMMWEWTRQEWSWIEATFKGESNYEMFPRYIAGALVTAEQQAEYSEFFSTKKADATLTRNITIGETELAAKVQLLERDGPAVRKTLLQ